MYLSTHAAVGVLISQTVDKPLPVFLLSFASHFLLDVIPHGDEDVERWARTKPWRGVMIALVDLGLLFVFLAALYATNNLPQIVLISAGIIGAVLPDLIAIVVPVLHQYTSWFFLIRLVDRLQHWLQLHQLWRGHNWIHHLTHRIIHKHISLRHGIALQFLILVGALVLAAKRF